MIVVALAGPAANLFMAVLWCAVLGAIARINGNETLIGWIALMAQAGIVINVVLALFNLLPIPPLDGGRVLAGLLPPRMGAGLEKLEPVGLFIVLGLSAFGLLGWLFDPAYHVMGRVINGLDGIRPSGMSEPHTKSARAVGHAAHGPMLHLGNYHVAP